MEWLKLEIFVPESHLQALRKALQSSEAGHIGNYETSLQSSMLMP